MDDPKKALITAGVVLGAGMGGFVDGILLHQILQTHGMLTGRIAKDDLNGYSVNMFWDGLFHSATWAVTAVGLYLLWKAVTRPAPHLVGRHLVAAMFVGWGLFNLVEGVIDHHVLHLHHVVESLGVSVYDTLFLLSGLAFVVLGGAALQPREVQEPFRPTA